MKTENRATKLKRYSDPKFREEIEQRFKKNFPKGRAKLFSTEELDQIVGLAEMESISALPKYIEKRMVDALIKLGQDAENELEKYRGLLQ